MNQEIVTAFCWMSLIQSYESRYGNCFLHDDL